MTVEELRHVLDGMHDNALVRVLDADNGTDCCRDIIKVIAPYRGRTPTSIALVYDGPFKEIEALE